MTNHNQNIYLRAIYNSDECGENMGKPKTKNPQI